jgi:hypothetical protein
VAAITMQPPGGTQEVTYFLTHLIFTDMDITVTFTGDTDSAEMAQMLKTLGIALQGKDTGYDGLKTAPTAEEQTEEKPAKKTRAKKSNFREATEEEKRAAALGKEVKEKEPEEAEQEDPQTEVRPSLEALSALVVAKAKEGKKTAIMAVFNEVGITRLQDADASIFVTLHEKLSAL